MHIFSFVQVVTPPLTTTWGFGCIAHEHTTGCGERLGAPSAEGPVSPLLHTVLLHGVEQLDGRRDV